MPFVNRRGTGRRGIRAAVLTAAAVAGLATWTSTGATAATAAPSPAPAAAPARPNCVVHLSRGGAEDCYATADEAIADATNGRVTAGPRNGSASEQRAFGRRLEAAAGRRNAVRAGAGGTLIGIEYEHDFWQADNGRKWYVEVDYGCDGDVGTTEWEVRTLGGNWWNDEISSARTYANCQVRHFEHSDFNGRYSEFTTWNPNLDLVGLNDMTSSLRWN
ncbi:hypothetical protein [Actinomadura roseirufa]|uniref:hypothetical protein n=1 Tax=Actinomadura roseirufa TaxID=2094049 RepID=UPI001040FB0A|nr:hypothetical protein [Actinomadura roseirufa]